MQSDSISYLKKKRMYEILKTIVDGNLTLIKNATYRFYRGSEWLECSSSDDSEQYRTFKLYHEGKFVSLDISQWDDKKENFVEVERVTYRINGEYLEKNMQISVSDKSSILGKLNNNKVKLQIKANENKKSIESTEKSVPEKHIESREVER